MDAQVAPVPPGGGDLRAAAAVARRHYLGGESKVDIAADLGLSRFKVARLLDLAKESGIVRIEIVEPVEEQVRDLAARLEERWGLRRCWVVSESGTVVEDLARASADLLVDLLGPDDVLGLPWSRSVYATVRHLRTLPRVPVVQLSGSIASSPEDSSSVDVVRRAGRIAGGGRQVFFAPLVMPDEDAAAAVRRDPSVRDTLAAASSVTVAMVGVGSWAPGLSTIYDAVEDAARREVAEAGAVGEAAGVFFDAQGQVVEPALTRRVVALTGEQFKGIATVLTSCHHVAKVESLSAALQGGLVDAVVVTIPVAEELLQA